MPLGLCWGVTLSKPRGCRNNSQFFVLFCYAGDCIGAHVGDLFCVNREAESFKQQGLELAEAERLEQEALARRERAVGHGTLT